MNGFHIPDMLHLAYLSELFGIVLITASLVSG
jgi:hypothetical protein